MAIVRHVLQADVLLLYGGLFSQRVYEYFRGSGKAAELKREAAQGAFRAAM